MARFEVGRSPFPSSLVSRKLRKAKLQIWSDLNHNRSRRILGAVGLAVLVISQALGEPSISAAEAKNHLGENATVCGRVASTHFAATSRGKPTFINLDEPYPNQIFTIVIWSSDRSKFGDPESTYRSKRICVSGTIESYRGIAQIIARERSQIKIQSE
jgi:hypothetical protein